MVAAVGRHVAGRGELRTLSSRFMWSNCAGQKQRAEPHGDLERKCFSWGWRDQQPWVCRLDVLDHR